MENTTGSPVKMTGWQSLPPEIQWAIWECVDDLLEEMLPEKAAVTAPMFVSREWRNYFQHYHFHTIGKNSISAFLGSGCVRGCSFCHAM
jgi:hypothetical protein